MLNVHIAHVFRRPGLINENDDSDGLTYKTRELNLKYPGILVLFRWEIGDTGAGRTIRGGGNDLHEGLNDLLFGQSCGKVSEDMICQQFLSPARKTATAIFVMIISRESKQPNKFWLTLMALLQVNA